MNNGASRTCLSLRLFSWRAEDVLLLGQNKYDQRGDGRDERTKDEGRSEPTNERPTTRQQQANQPNPNKRTENELMNHAT